MWPNWRWRTIIPEFRVPWKKEKESERLENSFIEGGKSQNWKIKKFQPLNIIMFDNVSRLIPAFLFQMFFNDSSTVTTTEIGPWKEENREAISPPISKTRH